MYRSMKKTTAVKASSRERFPWMRCFFGTMPAQSWVKLPDAILLAHCLREGDRIVLEKLLQEAQERFPHLK